MAHESGRERRRHTRFKVVPMYSTLLVRRDGPAAPSGVAPTAPSAEAPQATPAEPTALAVPLETGEPLSGHVYDISEGGVRFELDEPLADGERVSLSISLPGCPREIAASGRVVRVNDRDDDPGPRRMALMFESFADEATRQALRRYLEQRWLERAA